ncbi:hypothetical protein pipiens_005442, partial [Culex pipiens pipiens]
ERSVRSNFRNPKIAKQPFRVPQDILSSSQQDNEQQHHQENETRLFNPNRPEVAAPAIENQPAARLLSIMRRTIRNDNLEQKIQELAEALKATRQSSPSLQELLDREQAKCEELTYQLTNLNAKLGAVAQEVTRLTDDQEKLLTAHEAIKSKRDSLTEQIEELTVSMAVLEEKCRLEAEFERQDGEMEALGSLANAVQNRFVPSGKPNEGHRHRKRKEHFSGQKCFSDLQIPVAAYCPSDARRNGAAFQTWPGRLSSGPGSKWNSGSGSNTYRSAERETILNVVNR